MTRIRATASAIALGLLAGCTMLPPVPATGGGAPPPATSSGGDTGSAAPTSPSETLLAASRTARAAGAYPAAAAALERALRIAPGDPLLWIELAELRLLEGDREQAAALAQKALSLAAHDAGTSRRASAVLAAATR